jgi:hypothetical protein
VSEAFLLGFGSLSDGLIVLFSGSGCFDDGRSENSSHSSPNRPYFGRHFSTDSLKLSRKRSRTSPSPTGVPRSLFISSFHPNCWRFCSLADPFPRQLGFGLIDAYQAVTFAANGEMANIKDEKVSYLFYNRGTKGDETYFSLLYSFSAN